jgi:hypothetical protein
MRAALLGFFADRHVGSQATIRADGAACRAASDIGDGPLPLDQAFRCVVAMTRAEPSA